MAVIVAAMNTLELAKMKAIVVVVVVVPVVLRHGGARKQGRSQRDHP